MRWLALRGRKQSLRQVSREERAFQGGPALPEILPATIFTWKHRIIQAAGLTLLFGLFYWLIIIGEGTYLGRRAVRLIYQWGAARYDQVRGFPSQDDQVVLLPLLLGAIGTPAPARVLDVATGTGRVPWLLAGSSVFDGTVVGLDFAPAMLACAHTMLDGVELANRVALVLGDAMDLPLPAASFDMVVCLEALEYLPRPRLALAEMVRVLRPDGALVVSKFTDGWARLLPGKAFSSRAFLEELERLGIKRAVVRPWQPGAYDLVIARVPERTTPGTAKVEP